MSLDTKLDIFTSNTLLNCWNSYFDSNIKMDIFKTVTVDELFNMYLDEYIKTKDFDYCNKVVLVIKDGDNILVSNANITNELVKTKRDLDDYCYGYDIIITNFPFETPNHIVMRKEVIENIYTSNHTHFFCKELPFSYNNNNVFFTKIFYDMLISDKDFFDILVFNSELLNHFENGNNYNGLVIKPTVNISDFGRWYFSGCKIQNNKKFRNEIENKLKDINAVITVDMAAGEPTMFSNISGCQLISDLVKVRLSVSKEYSNMLKNMLNIYLHSLLSPKQSYDWFLKDNKDVCENFELDYGVSILNIYEDIDKETKDYNNKILESYKKNLSVVENGRRIVNPSAVIMTDKDIIKTHRNFLQGHVQYTVNKMLRSLVKIGIINMDNIVYTIFDSFTLLVDDNKVEDIKGYIKAMSKDMNIYVHIE